MSQPAYALPPGTTILGVNPGFTRKGGQKFDVQVSDGQVYTCFRPEQGSKAMSAVNQPATIMVSRSDDGRYQNFEDVILGVGAVAAPPQQFPQQQAAPVFTPAPGFVQAPDAKDIRICRGNAVNAASAALAPLIGTGIFLNEDGTVDMETIENSIVGLARGLAPYIIEGPGAKEGVTPAGDPAPLPPGVTPEQVAAYAAQHAATGAAVTVGTPVVAEAAPAVPEEKPY